MTVQEVEKLIETDLATFNLSKYFGTLPKDFVALFKKALLEIPHSAHQLKVRIMKDIIKKKETELSFMEVGMIINVIQAAPLYVLSDNLEAAINKFEKIEEIRVAWNASRNKKEQELLQKKSTMMQLVGGNGAIRMMSN